MAPKKTKAVGGLIELFQRERNATADSIMNFSFIKKRVKLLSAESNVKESSNGVLYWMFRDQRVQDNWAFLFAQKLALKNKVPLHVCFVILPKFLDANTRHYKFLAKGLEEVAHECGQLNIAFHLLFGDSSREVPNFVAKHNIGALVCDLSPLKWPMQWVDTVAKALSADVPFCQVDAHNIVPVWIASDKQEYSARTIRNKINNKLSEYLTEFPPAIVHPHDPIVKVAKIDWKAIWKHVEIEELDEVDWAVPGYTGGIKELQDFCDSRLKDYATKRNDPLEDAVSNLSPWYHFGNRISLYDLHERYLIDCYATQVKYPSNGPF